MSAIDRVPLLARLLLWVAVACVAGGVWQARAIWLARQEGERLSMALAREQAETAREQAASAALHAALAGAPATPAEPLERIVPVLALDLAERARSGGLTLTQRAWRSERGSGGDGDLRAVAAVDAVSGLSAVTLAFDLSFPTRTALAGWFAAVRTLPVQLAAWRVDGDRAHVEVRLFGQSGTLGAPP